MKRGSQKSAKFWTAPVLWRFGSVGGCLVLRAGIESTIARLVGKRQRTAAVQNAVAPV